MANNKKPDTSNFWYVIIPICILLLVCLFLYTIFSVPSIYLVPTRQVHAIMSKITNP